MSARRRSLSIALVLFLMPLSAAFPRRAQSTTAPASQSDDANPLSNRTGTPREKALQRFGGDFLTALAVAEALAMTHDPIFDRPLSKAIVHLARCQQPGGGWDYTAARTGRVDTSITGWVLMALKSAAAAGVSPPRECLWRILDHFDNA